MKFCKHDNTGFKIPLCLRPALKEPPKRLSLFSKISNYLKLFWKISNYLTTIFIKNSLKIVNYYFGTIRLAVNTLNTIFKFEIGLLL